MPAVVPATFSPVAAADNVTFALLLVHAPPAIASLNITEKVRHTLLAPEMFPGAVVTVTVCTAAGHAATEYETTVVPPVLPATVSPVAPAATVATEVVPLVQTPPGVPLLNSIVEPVQTWVAPLIVVGATLTVTVVVLVHPVDVMV